MASTDCAFLNKFPAEIRIKIYECLLVNEILGTPESVTKITHYGADLKYGLCIEVLLLCHQIHDEAVDVLYGKNIFYIACLRVDNHPYTDASPDYDYDDDSSGGGGMMFVEGPQVELSPLTRYENCHTMIPCPIPSLHNHSSVRKVRHWRAVVSRLVNASGSWDPRWCLIEFCKAISVKPPASLELLVLPCGLDNAEDDTYNFTPFEQITRPLLTMLRNLQKCVIKDGYSTDVPDIVALADDKWVEHFKEKDDFYWNFPEDLKMEIQKLVTSQQPIDLRHMMHHRLSIYAQAFERYRPYKMQMGLRREDIFYLDDRDPEYSEFLHTNNGFNPFNKPTFHPLEYALQYCKNSIDSDESFEEEFKPHRRNALQYLEPQWARIEKANRVMTEFIKQEKVPRGLFDVADRKKKKSQFFPNANQIHDGVRMDKIFLALVYLEEYAASFTRDLTHTISAQIFSQRRLFESHYKSLPRDRLIRLIFRETEVGKIRHFLSKFSTAVDMCDQQYLEILTARKKIFEFDGLGQWECDIDLCLNRSEEMINWNVNEPDLTPERKSWWGSDDHYLSMDDEM